MMIMPVTAPPKNGPLGRSKSRISASGYSTWNRCQKQWFLTRKVGLSSPTNIFQILGVVVEEALIDLLMHRPDEFETESELVNWARSLIPAISKKWFETGLEQWSKTTWKRQDMDFN